MEEGSLLGTKRTAFWLVLGKGILGEQLEEEEGVEGPALITKQNQPEERIENEDKEVEEYVSGKHHMNKAHEWYKTTPNVNN